MSVTKVCSNIKELDKDTQLALSYLTEALDAEKIEYRIFETFRSQERQNYLYSQGRTRPGQIVTWTTQSQHKTRRAIDIIHPINLWNMPNSYWKRIAELATEVGFTCGYYWPKQDKPHIQLNKGVTPKRIIKERNDYVVKDIEIAINGKIVTVPAVEIGGRTYPQLAALNKTGDIAISFNGMPLLDFAKKDEIISIDGEDVTIECIKVADRLYPKLADLNKTKTIKVGYVKNKPTIKTR